jgi:hypothetical protein
MPRRQLRLAAVEAAMQDKACGRLLRQLPVGHQLRKGGCRCEAPGQFGHALSMRAMTSATRRILLI